MFETDSDKIILINLRDGRVIFEENADTPTEVASLTKIMTAILAIENGGNLDNTVLITEEMVSGLDGFAVAGLSPGMTVSREELLYLTLLPSDGDAAQALAIDTAGSLTEFVAMMNAKAAELGMTNTHFSNPVGMDEGNYSTARDVATLLNYALKNSTFKTIFESFSYDAAALGKTIEKTAQQNGFFTGLKTGFTYEAGRCLASTATLNDVPYLLVNLNADWNSSNHVADAITVYDYYMNNYSYQAILDKGEEILNLEVKDSNTKNLPILAEETVEAYLPNNYDLKLLDYRYDGIETITNKNVVGDYLGDFAILNGEDVLYETEIYLTTEIEFYPYIWWNIGVVSGVVILVAILLTIFRRRKKAF